MLSPKPGPGLLRASVIIDYQNVHLTARDVFAPGQPAHVAVIDPMNFARRAVSERNSKQREGYPHARCSRVVAYRGLPHADYDPNQNAVCMAQAKEWRSSGAIVELRDLKYSFQRGADHRPVKDISGKKIPIGPGKEKGIDVLCALACVREARRPDVDLVILASRDTDLVPALDEVFDMSVADPVHSAKIETASWYLKGGKMFGSLRPTGPRRIWNTNLDEACFEASLDRRVYRRS